MKPALRKTIVPEPLLAGLLIAVAAALAYLPLAAQLGFYHDDWFPLVSQVSGVSLRAMHEIDRPMMGRVYEAAYAVLGDTPLNWHLALYFMRIAGAGALLGLLRLLWPQQRTATTWMALLYALYPGFLQSPSANNYLNHFIAYGIAIFSLGLTVLALQTRRRMLWALLTAAALPLVWLYPKIYEAMIGMEGLRLILIVYVLGREPLKSRLRQVGRVALHWAPYAAVLAYVVYKRLFVFKSVRVATDSSALLARYIEDPVGMLLRTVVETAKDWFENVFSAWVVPAAQLRSNLPANALWMLALLLAVLLLAGWYARRPAPEAGTPNRTWARDALIIGALGVLVTVLPVILSDRDAQFRDYLDRYTLQSSAATAIFLGGLGASLGNKWIQRAGLALLLGLALFTHWSNAVEYRDNWAVQKQVWWQMSWRAPQLQTGTALVVYLPAGQRYPEDFEVWAPANKIYAPAPGPLRITAQVLNADTAAEIAGGGQSPRDFRTVQYTRDYAKALIISMPSMDSCLHVLDGRQPELPAFEDALVRQVAGVSNTGQIVTGGAAAQPPADIFGSEPVHSWCYYYQKAALARQQGDWAQAARLGDEAAALGLSATDVSEWLPFLEAYLNLGRSADAERIAAAVKTDPATTAALCAQPREAWGAYSGAEAATSMVSLLCTVP